MKKTLNILGTIASYLLMAAFGAGVALYAVLPRLTVIPQGATKLDTLQQLILDRFIGDADATKMGDAAAQAMIEALGDRWSYYVSAEELADFQNRKDNTYVGVGITVNTSQPEVGLVVIEVAKGGGAEEAGILPGDIVVGVNGTNILGMDLTEASNLIVGDINTTVDLTVKRGEQEQTFTVMRKNIKTPAATGKLLEGDVGYITIENFYANCSKETIAAIEDVISQGAKYLVFDVRNNGGGYAHEMNELLDYLLPEGDLFKTEDYTGATSVDKSDADCLEMPMAVLVNENSYSAAEFFAVALWEYEWAKVAGVQTSGKGYYQVTYQLGDGSAVALSVGKYYTPKGNSLQGIGITPEIYVEVDDEIAAKIYAGIIAPEEDPQLQAAIQALKNGK